MVRNVQQLPGLGATEGAPRDHILRRQICSKHSFSPSLAFIGLAPVQLQHSARSAKAAALQRPAARRHAAAVMHHTCSASWQGWCRTQAAPAVQMQRTRGKVGAAVGELREMQHLSPLVQQRAPEVLTVISAHNNDQLCGVQAIDAARARIEQDPDTQARLQRIDDAQRRVLELKVCAANCLGLHHGPQSMIALISLSQAVQATVSNPT